MERTTGTYVVTRSLGEEVCAFVPAPLPPIPPITLDQDAQNLLHAAETALAHLQLACELVPSPGWFIYGFVRKEAVLTSQIEGTQATLEDLLTHEAETPKKPAADHPAQEVCNYLDALGFAREQLLDSRGLPLSLSLLRSPLLYVSLYFKQHRSEYYRRLDAVRASGDWEGWNRFFLEGIATIASQAIESARDLYALYNEDRKRLLAQERTSVPALRLLEYLPVHPLLTVAQAMDLLQSTRPTTTKAISLLVDLGILEERSGRRRGRTYAYGPYLDRLSQGTELEG